MIIMVDGGVIRIGGGYEGELSWIRPKEEGQGEWLLEVCRKVGQ